MFLINIGYQWHIATDLQSVRGHLFLPSGNNLEKLTRQEIPLVRRRFLDPQLYLSSLPAETCSKVCARLATFPWFGIDGISDFDSEQSNRRDWERRVLAAVPTAWQSECPSTDEAILSACRAAIQMQLGFSCTHIVLPAPLVLEREDEGALPGRWLDAGLRAAEELEVGQPLYATLAVHEQTLNDQAFEAAGFVDGLVDQVTSRGRVNGVYLVIAQNHARHPFETERNVVRGYAQLTRAIRRAGIDSVAVNFADVFGLVCMAFGATAIATGSSQSVRRLSLEGFEERGGGRSFPQFYSHRAIAELYSERDLDNIVSLRLFGRVEDVTRYSEPLVEVLRARGSAASVPAWAESNNNVTTAQKHFISRVRTEAIAIERMDEVERSTYVRNWLEEAAATQAYLLERIARAGEQLRGTIAPAQMWLEVFDEVLDS